MFSRIGPIPAHESGHYFCNRAWDPIFRGFFSTFAYRFS